MVLCLAFLAGFGLRQRRDNDLVVADKGATHDSYLKRRAEAPVRRRLLNLCDEYERVFLFGCFCVLDAYEFIG